jgi:hypothetical protein
MTKATSPRRRATRLLPRSSQQTLVSERARRSEWQSDWRFLNTIRSAWSDLGESRRLSHPESDRLGVAVRPIRVIPAAIFSQSIQCAASDLVHPDSIRPRSERRQPNSSSEPPFFFTKTHRVQKHASRKINELRRILSGSDQIRGDQLAPASLGMGHHRRLRTLATQLPEPRGQEEQNSNGRS